MDQENSKRRLKNHAKGQKPERTAKGKNCTAPKYNDLPEKIELEDIIFLIGVLSIYNLFMEDS